MVGIKTNFADEYPINSTSTQPSLTPDRYSTKHERIPSGTNRVKLDRLNLSSVELGRGI